MASPAGKWTVKETQSGAPDTFIEVTEVSSFVYEYIVFETPEATNELDRGKLLRRPGTNRFVFESDANGESGILLLEDDGVWRWQATTPTTQGGHWEEGWPPPLEAEE